MEQETGFRLQRRNFVILSVLLLFYYYSEATVRKIALGGVYVEFGNQRALLEFGWAIWIYFLIRYFQYFYVYGFKQYLEVYDEVCKSTIAPQLVDLNSYEFSLLPNDDYIKQSHVRLKISFTQNPFRHYIRRIWSLISCSVSRTTGFNLIGRRTLVYKKLIFLPFYLLLELPKSLLKAEIILYPPGGKDTPKGRYKERKKISLFFCVYTYFRINIIILIKHTAFFEYFMPFIIGFSPVAYKLFIR